jgi:hypothetical protein
MKWKSVLLGAIATLVVTILAGVAVYFLTKEPPDPPPLENLRYYVDPPVVFETAETTLALVSLRVANLGNLAAANVRIATEFESTSTILDAEIGLSSAPAATYATDTPGSSQFTVSLPVLAPDESVAITFLLDRAPDDDPTIGVKSDSTVGSFGPLTRAELLPLTPVASGVIKVALSILVTLPIPAGFVLYLRWRRDRLYQNVNNTAFLFIHNGKFAEAARMLNGEIEARGGNSYVFSNLAVCHAFSGEHEDAETYLGMALSAASSRHSKGVVAFNRSLAAFLKEDTRSGIAHLREALRLSKRAVKRYCSSSTLVTTLRETHGVLADLLQEQSSTEEST